MLSEPLVKLNSVYVKVQEALLHLRGDLLVGDTGVVGKAVGGTARIFDAPAFYAQQVRQILRKFGADAHMFMPGPGMPVLGPNLVTNGDFSNGLTGWNANGVGAVVGGELQITAPGNTSYPGCNTLVTTIPGRVYSVSISGRRGTSSSAAALAISRSGGSGNLLGQAFNFGTAQTTFSTTITSDWAVWDVLPHISGTPAAAGTCLFDNIEIREILGYTSRINGFEAANFLESTGNTYAALDGAVGLVLDAAGSVGPNLVTSSSGVAGTYNGTTLVDDATNANHYVQVAFSSPANRTQITAKVKAGTKSWLWVYFANYTAGSVWFDLANGLVGTQETGVSGKITPLGGGEYEITVTKLNNTASVNGAIVATNANGSTAAYTGTNSVAFYARDIAVREVTGTYATQTTTANKPILRRGIVNLLPYSNDLTNAAWSRAGTPVVTGGQADHLGGTTAFQFSRTTIGASYLAQTYTKSASALQYTLAVVMKAGTSRYSSLRAQGSYPSRVDAIFDMQTGVVNSVSTAGSFSGSAASITSIGDGYYLCTVSATTDANGGLSVHTSFNSTAMPIDGSDVVSSGTGYYSGFGLFQGTLTAQQILAAGGIPLTTTAPASSQYGAYAWQFDGSNDVLTAPVNTGVAGYIATIVSPSALGWKMMAGSGSQLASNPGVRLGIAGSSNKFLFESASGSSGAQSSDTATVEIGKAYVVSGRWNSATQSLRVNGVEKDSRASAAAASTNGFAIGAGQYGALSDYFSGNIGLTLLINGDVSVSDAKVIDKWLGSIAGVAVA